MATSAVTGAVKNAGKFVPAPINLPTRVIADVLLRAGPKPIAHEVLYQEADKSGLMRSHRHFKHCLRMMKDQNRVKVICLGPEKVGSAKRKFAVGLTRKGTILYTKYFKGFEAAKQVRQELKPAQKADQTRGLQDAL